MFFKRKRPKYDFFMVRKDVDLLYLIADLIVKNKNVTIKTKESFGGQLKPIVKHLTGKRIYRTEDSECITFMESTKASTLCECITLVRSDTKFVFDLIDDLSAQSNSDELPEVRK